MRILLGLILVLATPTMAADLAVRPLPKWQVVTHNYNLNDSSWSFTSYGKPFRATVEMSKKRALKCEQETQKKCTANRQF